jgi:hypothetical protein
MRKPVKQIVLIIVNLLTPIIKNLKKMKKAIYFLTLTVLFLHACSSSDDNSSDSPSPSLILCKKIIETDPDGVYTTNYTYNGNKIIKGTLLINYNNGSSGERIANFTYDGELISQTEIFVNNTIVEKWIYNYNQNNKLASYIELNYTNNTGRKMVYTHNANGTINSIEYSGNLVAQNTVESDNVITFSNGEVISLVENYGGFSKTSTYIYDNKNYAFKNVLGLDKISFAVVGTFISEISHNLIQITTTQSGAPTSVTNVEYTYNSDNFPTTSAETWNGFTDETCEYFY